LQKVQKYILKYPEVADEIDVTFDRKDEIVNVFPNLFVSREVH